MNETNKDLQSLYQSVVLDHNKNPRNFGKPQSYTLTAEGFNPLCGDHYFIYATVDDEGGIEHVHFEGQGCAISKASASLMTQTARGLAKNEFENTFSAFQNMVLGKNGDESSKALLGKLKVFEQVWKYPSRVKCAALPWHALKAALAGQKSTSTEEKPLTPET